MSRSWKNTVVSGVIAGIIWGWMSLAANSVTGAFEFEHNLIHNLASFTFAGAVFGLIAAGFLSLAGGYIPFKGMVMKSLAVSVLLWVIFEGGGIALSGINPDRYHPEMIQAVQGFSLSVVMGILLGTLFKRDWTSRI